MSSSGKAAPFTIRPRKTAGRFQHPSKSENSISWRWECAAARGSPATDERVLITAIFHADGNSQGWTSPDIGKTWKELPTINTAAWLDLRTGGIEPWFRLSLDGGATWAPDASIYASPDGHVCECCAPNVAISSSSEVAVSWRNWLGGSRDVFLAASRDGLSFFPAQKLGTGTWKLNGCPMDGGGLAFSPGGDWLAVWQREKAVFVSEPGAPESLLASDAAQPIVAYAGKTPLVLWEANGELMLKKGADKPVQFAGNAKAASIASGPVHAAIVWEATVDGEKKVLFDILQ